VSLIAKARDFAIKAHGEQKRKYTGEPYVVHTQEVADIVQRAGGDPVMVAAAHLHDVIEDTPVTLDEVREAFGPAVAALVSDLSDQIPLSYGNRKARKRAESDRLAACDARVQTIKLADIISNARSICELDPGFAFHAFVPECRYLVERMDKGDDNLRAQARAALATPPSLSAMARSSEAGCRPSSSHAARRRGRSRPGDRRGRGPARAGAWRPLRRRPSPSAARCRRGGLSVRGQGRRGGRRGSRARALREIRCCGPGLIPARGRLQAHPHYPSAPIWPTEPACGFL
jgi:hypothetical protein